MYIKKLEIFGFKSFRNKTVLEFDLDHITGFVGPNGCGKSNVVDALLWVMGETSPKHLRGETLSDVIFGGTKKEAPGNLAEVTLTLNKGDNDFPENYKDFSEIMITRRAHRDGKNEYFINSQPCLLRDIREFFMNTGAGCRGFSIIEQESIEKLITAKPHERRFIIEEVAGITKFKSRKQESVRKLDLVNQNLRRLDDILTMQESQLAKLTSQAKKAEKYRKLKQEIDLRQQDIEQGEKEDFFHVYTSLKKEQDQFKVQKSEKIKTIPILEKQIDDEKNNLSHFETQIESARQRAVKQQVEESDLKHKIQAFKMIESIKSKKVNLKQKEKQIQEELFQLQDFFKNGIKLEEFESEMRQIEVQLEEVRQNKKEVEVEWGVIEKQIHFLEDQEEHFLEDQQTIKTQIQDIIKNKNQSMSKLEKNKQMQLVFDKDIKIFCENEKNLESRKKELENLVAQLDQEISALKYKIEGMSKLIAQFENVNEGVVHLKKSKPQEFKSLFESLKVDSDYTIALGAVLGHHVQALVPTEDIYIEQAVRDLKERRKGKASFLSSLPSFDIPVELKEKLKTYPAFVCFLDEKVQWNIHTEPLRSFLSQTVVVSSLNSAFELKKEFSSFQFVTKEGDIITRDSLIYAGSIDKEINLFQIRDQVNNFSVDVQVKENDLKIKQADLENYTEQFHQVKRQRESLQGKNTQTSGDLIYLKKDVEQMEKELVKISEHRTKKQDQIDSLEKEKQNLLKHKESCNKEIQNLNEILSKKASRLEVLQIGVEEYRVQDVKQSQWNKDLLDNSKDQKSLDQEISLLFNLVNKSDPSISSEESIDKEQKGKSLALDFEEKLKFIDQEKKKIEESLLSSKEELEQKTQAKSQKEKEIEDLENKKTQIKMDINDTESNLEKKELEKTYLKNQFLEKYKMQIEDFVPLSSSEKIVLDKLKKEISHYEDQLNRIQEVNFLALEEYAKLSKENLFLNTQKEDLVNSRKELMKVISHIDSFCEERFQEMLKEINKRFSKVFPIVFQGDNAKAELILREDSENKESGVDILIHPPGKRPQSVTLLSRGEKALTSICLIYSLFLVKPSPFCIIDEADAPLDDANIFRFLSVLKEMSRKSQIITITHNKYTMQTCKKLYGVTMERPGISQIVSVDMDNVETFSSASLNLV